jgi:hypothetical protein
LVSQGNAHLLKGHFGEGRGPGHFAAYKGNIISKAYHRTANALHPLIENKVVGYGEEYFFT